MAAIGSRFHAGRSESSSGAFFFKQVLAKEGSYHWVEYLYIDDPVSSLDDNNAIAVACDLAELLRRAKQHTKLVKDTSNGSVSGEREESAPIRAVISSHHALFFNVIVNELKTENCKTYFMDRPRSGTGYTLRAVGDTPFLQHVALLSDLRKAADSRSGKLYTYHFNMLRVILEKTAVFFGKRDFSDCLKDDKDRDLFARALNFQSHGQHSPFEPSDMPEYDKKLFRSILNSFLDHHQRFHLPDLEDKATAPAPILAPATGATT